MGTLAHLIKDRQAGRSLRALAAQAQRLGFNIGHSRFVQWASQPITRFPARDHIKAISVVLDVPTIAVVLACAESLDLVEWSGEGQLARALPAEADDLPPDDRDLIISLTRRLVELRLGVRVDLRRLHDADGQPTGRRMIVVEPAD